jgi:D-psicose/D-tagatose/L-ribulose 3-epimerase
MRLGVNTLIWSAEFDAALIPFDKLRKVEVEGLEIPVFDPKNIDAKALKQTLKEHKLACTLVSINPAGANPISTDAKVRDKALKHWKQVIDTAAELDCELICGPSYAPVGDLPGRRRNAEEWIWAVEFHQKLAPFLKKKGVELAVEPLNRFETYFLNTAEDAVKFVEEVDSPNIGVLLDSFHSNIEDKSVAVAYRQCGKHLKHVHTCENDRGIPGSGHVDWPGILRSLQVMGYDGWLTIESFNSTIPELSAATAIWRDLAPHPDDIAIQGTAFLKKLWAAV